MLQTPKLKTMKGVGRSHSLFFLPSPYATDPRGGRFACPPLDVLDTLQSKHEYARCAREGQGDWFKSSLPLYRLCPLSRIPHCGCSAIAFLYIATATSKEYTFFSNNFPQDRSQRESKQGQTGHKALAFLCHPKRRGTSIAAAGTSTEFAPGRATAARHNYIL